MEIKKECQIVCIFFYYLTEEVSRLNFAFIKITKLLGRRAAKESKAVQMNYVNDKCERLCKG